MIAEYVPDSFLLEMLLQFCLGTGEQISANRLCVKGDAKANRCFLSEVTLNDSLV
jgi:hypothetical protein